MDRWTYERIPECTCARRRRADEVVEGIHLRCAKCRGYRPYGPSSDDGVLADAFDVMHAAIEVQDEILYRLPADAEALISDQATALFWARKVNEMIGAGGGKLEDLRELRTWLHQAGLGSRFVQRLVLLLSQFNGISPKLEDLIL